MIIFTIFIQILLLVYRQLIVVIDLYPFNDLERYPMRYKIPEIIVNGIFMILPPIGFMWHIKILMIYALIFYPSSLLGSLIIWWADYFFGYGFGHRKLFQELFGRTIRFLPPIKGRPAPDAQHCILHLLIALTMVSTYLAYFMK